MYKRKTKKHIISHNGKYCLRNQLSKNFKLIDKPKVYLYNINRMESNESLNEIQQRELEPKPEAKKSRVWEIDFLRGVLVLGMIVDHFAYLLSDLPHTFYNFTEVNNPFFNGLSKFFYNWFYEAPYYHQYFHNFAAVFFLISGIACTFSRNNLKHSLRILLFSLVLDLFTYFVFHISYAIDKNNYFDFRILFGVLFALGIGDLFIALIQKIPNKNIHKWIYLGLSIAIAIYGFIIPLAYYYPMAGYEVDSPAKVWYYLLKAFDEAPAVWMCTPATATNWFEATIGLSVKNFFKSLFGLAYTGSDYFSVFPWIAFSFLGAFLGTTVYKDKKSLLPKLDGKWHRGFDWFSKQALWIYIFHQAITLLLIILIMLPFGYRLF